MTLRYGSVSSGIECAAIAWAPLGWTPAFLAEIDPFASTVLHHHHSSGRPRHMPDPDAPGLSAKDRKARRTAIKAVEALPSQANGVPNHGDMTTFEEWPDAAIDLLVGGTPCQAFSVAGLREGLDDPRGDLTLTYAAIARRYRPRWVVWENVFGVLSHDRGRSFASLLGLLSGRRVEVPAGGWKSAGVVEGYSRAYGLAWRVLDTQYVRVDGFGRAIPQGRRRVFVVGYLGDWRRAAAVFLEREGLSGDPAPRRRAGEEAAPTVAGGARSRGGYGADDIPLAAQAFGGGRTSGPVDVAACLTAKGQRIDFEVETFVASVEVHDTLTLGANQTTGFATEVVATREVASTLTRGTDSKGKGGPAGRRQEDDDNLVAQVLTCSTGSSVSGSEADTRGTASTPALDVGETTGLPKGRKAAALSTFAASAATDHTSADVAPALTRNPYGDNESRDGLLFAHTLRAEGFDASEDGTGRGTPIVPIPFDTTQITSAGNYSNPQPGDPCHPLSATAHPPAICFNSREDPEVTWDQAGALGASSPQAQAIAFQERGRDGGRAVEVGGDVAYALTAKSGGGRSQEGNILHGWAVRRLTPREWCRLQGIPADYFDEVIWRGKPAPDGQIYKTLGNGFSANAVRWIGRRIEMVEALDLDHLSHPQAAE